MQKKKPNLLCLEEDENENRRFSQYMFPDNYRETAPHIVSEVINDNWQWKISGNLTLKKIEIKVWKNSDFYAANWIVGLIIPY